MKIKTILAAVAIAVAAFAFSSCQKIDTGKDAGGYYIRPTVDASGVNAEFIIKCNEAMLSLNEGVVYKTTENDNKAIAACDKVYANYKSSITVSFELYFQNAVAEGQTPKKQVIKVYAPAK